MVVAPQRSIWTRENSALSRCSSGVRLGSSVSGSAPGEIEARRESIVARDIDDGGHEFDADVAVQVDEAGADEPARAGRSRDRHGRRSDGRRRGCDRRAWRPRRARRSGAGGRPRPRPSRRGGALSRRCRLVGRRSCAGAAFSVARPSRGASPRFAVSFSLAAWANGAILGRRAVTGRRVAATDRPKSRCRVAPRFTAVDCRQE